MTEKCPICHGPPRSKFAKYCQDCSKLINRLIEVRKKKESLGELQ